jgi:hypothetical protein
MCLSLLQPAPQMADIPLCGLCVPRFSGSRYVDKQKSVVTFDPKIEFHENFVQRFSSCLLSEGHDAENNRRNFTTLISDRICYSLQLPSLFRSDCMGEVIWTSAEKGSHRRQKRRLITQMKGTFINIVTCRWVRVSK